MTLRHRTGATASSISLTAIAMTSLWSFAMATNPTNPQGCFSSGNGMTLQGHWPYQSQGYCQQQCLNQGSAVMGLTGGGDCWCGSLLPPPSSKGSDSSCNVNCLGWPAQTCGGDGFFQVFLTGTSQSVGSAQDTTSDNNDEQNNNNNDQGSGGGGVINSPPPPSETVNTVSVVSTIVSQHAPVTSTAKAQTVTAGGDTTTIPPSVVTVGNGVTQVVTLPPSTATVGNAGAQHADPSPSAADSGTSTGTKVGIAVGVVVAVLALAAAIGFAVFYFLKKKRSEYAGGVAAGSPGLARNNTGNSFSTNGGFANSGTAPGGWARHGSANDSRLDPGMVDTRRGSVGSMFDDSEDYSRRVLKVTNE